MTNNPHTPSGTLAAWIGSVVGGLLTGVPCAFVGAGFGDASTSGFDEIATGITYATYGFLLGAWIGASIGCAAALRTRGYTRALATGATLACLLVTGWLLWSLVLIELGDVLAIYIPLIGAVASPVAARALATRRSDYISEAA